MKNIAVIGSTGSIGTQTLNVIRRNPDKFKVRALYAHSSVELLLSQAHEFNPTYLAIGEDTEKLLRNETQYKIYYGPDAAEKLCEIPEIDIVVVAVVGMVGLNIVLSALKNNKIVALANKESLVAGGALIKEMLSHSKGKILPIDSEHNAVWQCLMGQSEKPDRIILTASGGPFFGYTAKQLKEVTLEQALKHPNWKMGSKISIDSATMMNKALEIIEARWLFDSENIDYIIHPESIIHALVEFKDGSLHAVMSKPNMEIPISYVLSYPERLANPNDIKFNFDRTLNFYKPDEEVFYAPKLAYKCLSKGGNMPCALNAANEAAVKLFMDGKIRFDQITEICANILEHFDFIPFPTLKDLHYTYDSIMKSIIA